MKNRLLGMNRGAMEAFWEMMNSMGSATLVLLLVEANRKDPMVADCRFQIGIWQSIWPKVVANRLRSWVCQWRTRHAGNCVRKRTR